jgi:hypothetical protein
MYTKYEGLSDGSFVCGKGFTLILGKKERGFRGVKEAKTSEFVDASEDAVRRR